MIRSLVLVFSVLLSTLAHAANSIEPKPDESIDAFTLRARGEWQARLRRNLPELRRRNEGLEALAPIFAAPKTGKDAGEFFNRRLTWESRDPVVKEFNEKNADQIKAFQIPEAIKTQVDAAGASWATVSLDLKGIDFGWMAKLKGYRYWDLSSNSPEMKKIEFLWGLPFPDYQGLVAWSKVRLLRGIQQKKLGPAVDEVKQLIRLLGSTEHIGEAVMSLTLLNMVVGFEQAHGLPPSTKPFDRKLLASHLMNSPKLLSSELLDSKLQDELIPSAKNPFACMILGSVGEYAFSGGELILDPSQKPIIEHWRGFFAKAPAGCRIKLVKAAWAGDTRFNRLQPRTRDEQMDQTHLTLQQLYAYLPESYVRMLESVKDSPRWARLNSYFWQLLILDSGSIGLKE